MPILIPQASLVTCRYLQTVAILYLRGTNLIYLPDRICLYGFRSCRVVHTSLIAITYLVIDPNLDHNLDHDRLMITGHMVWSTPT